MVAEQLLSRTQGARLPPGLRTPQMPRCAPTLRAGRKGCKDHKQWRTHTHTHSTEQREPKCSLPQRASVSFIYM